MTDKYPIFVSPEGKEYKCIAHAVSGNGWEWYGFEIEEQTSEDTLYFGYVMGFENEWGYWGRSELEQAGVVIATSPYDLSDIAPPSGWNKKGKKRAVMMLNGTDAAIMLKELDRVGNDYVKN